MTLTEVLDLQAPASTPYEAFLVAMSRNLSTALEECATLASKRGVMRALRACQFTYREDDPVVCGQGSDALTSAARHVWRAAFQAI